MTEELHELVIEIVKMCDDFGLYGTGRYMSEIDRRLKEGDKVRRYLGSAYWDAIVRGAYDD